MNSMQITRTQLAEVLLIEPQRFEDARGFFVEIWNQARFETIGLPPLTAQDNLSWSHRDVLRGLHFQSPYPQAKLVSVLHGSVFDVVVDVRIASPNFGRWVAIELSSDNASQLYVPEGFAHGFCVLSGETLVGYKCSAPYRPDCERGVLWSDPSLAIPWPSPRPIVSARDAAFCGLEELAKHLAASMRMADCQAIPSPT